MGFKPKPKGVRITCDWPLLAPEDGSESLQATIPRLTFGEIREIPVFTAETTFGEMHEVLAPYVLDWNCVATNLDTGEDEPVPAPAEAGPSVFLAVDALIPSWLNSEIRQIHLAGEDLPKEPRHSNATPAPVNGDGSGSRPVGATSRKSQPTTT